MSHLAQQSGHPALDQWDDLINSTCATYGIEPNLMKAHIEHESGGNPNVVGSSGRGCGLGQIDYGTYQDSNGTWWYSSVHGKTDQIFVPAVNLKIMARDFMAPLKAAFPNNLAARIAGYNAGIEPVQNAIDNGTDLTTVTYDPAYIGLVTASFNWFEAQAAT